MRKKIKETLVVTSGMLSLCIFAGSLEAVCSGQCIPIAIISGGWLAFLMWANRPRKKQRKVTFTHDFEREYNIDWEGLRIK